MRAGAPKSSSHDAWLPIVWGFAEATFFFIVPDVLTSRRVLQDSREGFAACAWSLVGALIGGLALFFAGRDPSTQASLLAWMDWLPGINPGLIDRAAEGLSQHGLLALFTGVLAGIPYKLFAVQSAGLGIGAGVFLLTSAAARLARFALVTGFAWLVATKVFGGYSLKTRHRIHLGAWFVFYIIYFWRMGL